MPSFLAALLTGLEHIRYIHSTHLSSACIIIFDHLITLDPEINLIWPSPWTLAKVLFFLNRYYSLAAAVFNTYGNHRNEFFEWESSIEYKLTSLVHTNKNSFSVSIVLLSAVFSTESRNQGLDFYQWQGWTGIVACLLAEAILLTRLYALYSLNKKILAFMLTCFTLSLATSAYIMGSVLSKLVVTPVRLPTGGTHCVASNVAENFYMFWIPLLAFECLLCGLALFKGLQTLRSRRSVLYRGRMLIVILLRDSILYFFAICATYLTTLLIWMFAPLTLMQTPIGFTIAMSCVLANRVLLNVKEAGRTGNMLNASHPPLNARNESGLASMSFGSPGTLSQFEMGQLRSMEVKYQIEDFFEASDEEYDVRKVPWVVR